MLRQKKFQNWRLFTDYQIQQIQDELQAPLRTDQTTYFSMRPPELRFVREQKLYLRWFERHSVTPLYDPATNMKYLQTALNEDFSKNEWLDGFNFKITLRRGAMNEILEYVKSCPEDNFDRMSNNQSSREFIVDFFQQLKNDYCRFESSNEIRGLAGNFRWMRPSLQETIMWEKKKDIFLSKQNSTKLPVIWWTPVYPKRKTAFLIQLLLSLGSFVTEYDLMLEGSLKRAFIKAKLFDPDSPEQSIRILLRRYVLEQLRLVPGSTFQFDRNLCQAVEAVKELLLGESTNVVETPSVLYAHMKKETSDKAQAHFLKEKKRLVTTVHNELSNGGFHDLLPPVDDILAATVDKPIPKEQISLFFPPPKSNQQSTDSHKEQNGILNDAIDTAFKYMNPAARGSGKSLKLISRLLVRGVGCSVLLESLELNRL